jgi:hypothetical protein
MMQAQGRPRVGTWVITRDGKDAGKVAEVNGHYIKVSAPAILDYWLPIGDVADTTEKETMLTVSKEELDGEKLAGLPDA